MMLPRGKKILAKSDWGNFIPYFTLGATKFVLTSIIIRYTTNLNYKKK